MKILNASIVVLSSLLGVATSMAAELNDAGIDNVVRRSYQYVAMYNTNNNFAMQERNPFSTHGWNKFYVPDGLMDHTVKVIPRPNNDTLYSISMLDLRDDAVVIQFPAVDSIYASLETSAYDHYVDIPLSTTKGDFQKPTTILFYSSHTDGYNGEPVSGVDKVMKMTGDFAMATLRVTPHASEPERMKRNLAAMKDQRLLTLSEYQGRPKKPVSEVTFPEFSNDRAVFKNNFLQVMQFVFNHTSFDPENEMDQAALAALKPLGVEPGKDFDNSGVARIDGDKFAKTAADIRSESLDIKIKSQGSTELDAVFLPKGEMTLRNMVIQSAVGPVGLPTQEAQYPSIGTIDGQPMLASEHYVIGMTQKQLPPTSAFWSATLYDSKSGLFIPNEGRKYSVGENGGVKLDEQGGVEIHIAPAQPEGVPAQNWLPSGGGAGQVDVMLRVYGPDIEAMKVWQAPKAIKL